MKQKEVDRRSTAVERIDELERRLQKVEGAPDKDEVRGAILISDKLRMRKSGFGHFLITECIFRATHI